MYKITIDPGHGGRDRANRGPTGYIEADGVLRISLLLEEELKKSGAFLIQLTRREDKYLYLRERGEIAASNKSHLFISQHTNAFNTRASGAEVFYSVDLPKDRQFADKLSNSVALALGIPNRGAKTRPSKINPSEDYYTVIDTAQDGGVPHVLLVESAFHDNPAEERLLKDEAMLRKIAQAQAKVICDWFEVPLIAVSSISDITNSSIDNSIINNIDINTLAVLRRNTSGNSVKLLQTMLNKLGFDSGIVDGIFGIKTLSAVKSFQSNKSITIDGIVGKQTWSTLFTAIAEINIP